MRRSELPKGERRLLAIIEQCDFTGKGCCPTQKELTFLAGFKNHRYTNRLVKNLERKGCLRIEKRRSAGCKWFHNVYHVTHWSPHVRRGICNLRREWPRVRAEQEAAAAESGSERTATASRAQTPPSAPFARCQSLVNQRCGRERFEIRRSSVQVHGTQRRFAVPSLTCPSCQELAQELDRARNLLRSQAVETSKVVEEYAGVQEANRVLAKEITNLKRNISRQARESAKAEQVEAVIEHWKKHRPKTRASSFPPGGKNWQTIEKALNLMAEDEDGPVQACREAIDGLHIAPFEAYGRRYMKDGPNRTLRNRLEHALGDETRIERCRGIVRRVRQDGADRAWELCLVAEATYWALTEIVDEQIAVRRRGPVEPAVEMVTVDGLRVRSDGR